MSDKYKILIFEVENGMIGQGCAWGFESLGHTTKRITFEVDKKSHYQLQYDLKNLIREVLTFAPDFVLTLNFRGFDADGHLLYILHRLSVPVLVWFVDNPFSLIHWDKYRFADRFVKLVFDREYAARLRNKGIRYVYHLPLGTDTRYFRKLDLTPEEQTRYGTDVCFVGKLDAIKAQLLRHGLREKWPDMPPGVMEIIEEAIRIQADNPQISARQALGEVGISFPDAEVERLAEIIVEFEASIHYRANLIGRLKPYDVAIYGEDDWREALDFIHLRGVVPYGPELARVYNASSINLNISRVQLKSSVNQRVFDVPACQSFLITDYREELSDYFDIGKEVVCYRQPDELPGLIQYYFDHPEERKKIAQAGYERVIREHTYIHRMGRVVEIFSELVRDKGRPGFSEWEDKAADEMLGQIFNELSKNYLRDRNIKDAGFVLEKAVSLYPYDESFLCNLALVKSREGKMDEAERLYLLSLQENPGFMSALVNLGHLYLRQGQLEKAEYIFRRAIDGSEENPPLPPFAKGGDSLSCPSLKGDTGGFLYENSGVVDIHAALGRACAGQNKIEACVAEAGWLADRLGFSGEVVLNNLRDLAELFDAISAELGRQNRSAEADLTRKTAEVLNKHSSRHNTGESSTFSGQRSARSELRSQESEYRVKDSPFVIPKKKIKVSGPSSR